MVIVAVLAAFVAATGKWRNPASLPGRSLLFLGETSTLRGWVAIGLVSAGVVLMGRS
ncbi:MAG: hypothetical protein ACREL3_07585 [Gemmatimonadales bacterium]